MKKLVPTEWGMKMDYIKSQGMVLVACIMLSCDVLNPIQLISSVFGFPTCYMMYPFATALAYLIVVHWSDIVYFSVRVFFISIASIFFSKVDVIGHSNIPIQGPVIFTGNHANQFVDAIQVMTNCGHKVGFLIARKSFNQRVVGDFAKMVSCIPVMRPQDAAVKMPDEQLVVANGSTINGINTKFTKSIENGDKIRFRGHPTQLKVKTVVSDTCIELSDPVEEELEENVRGKDKYDILKYVDQSRVFDEVHKALARGRVLGIFPEGGSHDRTDLLPLKVGVAIIAFGCMEKFGINVPVVPIGLNYYRGHRFRGRAVVEFGPPITISDELYELYLEDKKRAYSQFMLQVENGMRGCVVTASNYETLQMLYTARRVFQKGNLTPEAKQDLNRRFTEGYKILLRKYADIEETSEEYAGMNDVEKAAAIEQAALSHMPPEAADLKRRVMAYRNSLSRIGVKDYQVQTLQSPSFWRTIYVIIHMVLVFLITLLPSLVLNAPVGIIARITANQERKKALAGSVVKITGRDVMMSKKIIISIALVPILWFIYAVMLFTLTDWHTSTCVLIILCMPIFSYIGVMGTELGMVDLKDLRVMLTRLKPSLREEMMKLPEERRELQLAIRAFVKEVGPSLGPIYNEPDLRWGEVIEQSKTLAKIEQLAGQGAHAMEPGKYSPVRSRGYTPSEGSGGVRNSVTNRGVKYD